MKWLTVMEQRSLRTLIYLYMFITIENIQLNFYIKKFYFTLICVKIRVMFFFGAVTVEITFAMAREKHLIHSFMFCFGIYAI